MGSYHKNRFREKWLRGEFDESQDKEKKKDKNLDEFENKSKEVKNENN